VVDQIRFHSVPDNNTHWPSQHSLNYYILLDLLSNVLNKKPIYFFIYRISKKCWLSQAMISFINDVNFSSDDIIYKWCQFSQAIVRVYKRYFFMFYAQSKNEFKIKHPNYRYNYTIKFLILYHVIWIYFNKSLICYRKRKISML